MRILLTGGCGYIGSHTALSLLAAGHEPVLFDNLSNSAPAVADHISVIAGRPLPVVVGDVRDPALLRSVLQEHSIDAVIHFAALKSVVESISDPLSYHANNVTRAASGRIANLRVYGNDYRTEDGTAVRGYIHVMDLADGHVAALRALQGGKTLQVYNLGTGRGTSVLELIDTFERATDVKVPFLAADRRPGDVSAVLCLRRPRRRSANWTGARRVRYRTCVPIVGASLSEIPDGWFASLRRYAQRLPVETGDWPVGN